MKKIYLVAYATLLMFLLAACTEQQKEQQEFIEVNEAKATKTVVEIEESKLFTWAVTDMVDAVVVKDGGEIVKHKKDSFRGLKGEESYEGNVQLFLVYRGMKEGYLQDEVKGIQLNLSQAFMDQAQFSQYPILSWTEATAENHHILTMWRFLNNELQRIGFDGEQYVELAHQELHWKDDQYLQTNLIEQYDNGKYDVKWQFLTWEWDEETASFKKVYHRVFQDTALNRLGQMLTDQWLEDDGLIVPFKEQEETPYLLEAENIELMKAGAIEKNGPKIGDSMLDAMFQMPANSTGGMTDEGLYVTFMNSYTYVYEPKTYEIKKMFLNSRILEDSLADVRGLIGETTADSFDFDATLFTEVYRLGDYQLTLIFSENQKGYTLELQKN